MAIYEDNLIEDTYLNERLGAPIKKHDGLSCDERKAESEHLHAFREDVNIGEGAESGQIEM